MSTFARYTGGQSGGGGGSGIQSINADTTAAQVIAGGSNITVATAAGTTTVSQTSSSIHSINADTTSAQVIAAGSGISVSTAAGTTTISQSNSEFNAGNSGTTKTLDFNNGPAQLLTLTGNVTLTLSNAVAGGAYLIRIATGAGSFTVTWPAAVKWPNGTAPTITTTASKVDLVNLYSDGTNFYGSFSQNY